MISSSSKSLSGVRVLHLAAADSMLNPNLRDQLLYLRDEGCLVSTASIDGPLARRLRDEDGFDWTQLPLSREFAPFSDLRAVRFIQNLCREKRFDIVHTHTPKGNLIGQWGARLAGTPIVLQTLHGFYFHDRMNWAARQAWIEIERFSARHSDHILCQNPEDVETAIREKIIGREHITELGNGIDLDRFVPVSDEKKREIRTRLGIPPDARVIGMVGRFVAEKGFPEFLAAARILASESDDIYFLAIGHRVASERRGDRFDFDASTLPDHDILSKRLIVLHDRDDMPELYGAMDAHVLPSHREGFPRALIEGAACGLPQVATDIRGCRQAIVKDVTGILTPLRDEKALAQALKTLLESPTMRKNMGVEARNLANRKFDRRTVFRILNACYQRLLR
ncbi:MAG: glycosyltransferase family 4 protein [Planctomycetota bacterium]